MMMSEEIQSACKSQPSQSENSMGILFSDTIDQ